MTTLLQKCLARLDDMERRQKATTTVSFETSSAALPVTVKTLRVLVRDAAAMYGDDFEGAPVEVINALRKLSLEPAKRKRPAWGMPARA